MTRWTRRFPRLCGKDGYTSVYCGQGELFRVPALRQRTDAYLELVKQAGAEFARGAILPETARALRQPLFPRAVFEQMADASWGVSREDTAAAKTPEAGRLSPAQAFTRQMAALYDPASWDGKDRVLEFFYTDTGETCQIVLGKDGQRVLQSDFLPCTTRIETPLSVWQKIGSGELDGKQAMMEHQYRVTGDFSVMLHWDEIFGLGAAAPQPSAEPRKKTNMTLMLLPWMAIWIALSIHAQIGACIGLAVCALLPFAFLNYRMTVFEPCSILAVGTICVLTLLDALPLTLLLPASYLLFGLMWGVTVFLPMPLTAYYSMNGYGGETALQNPLFMHTNRILTACWAVLYLLTPVWTWYLLQTPVSYLTGAVNSPPCPCSSARSQPGSSAGTRRITPQAKNNDTHAVPLLCRSKRMTGGAFLHGRELVKPPAAPFFSTLPEKKGGEKGRLDAFGAYCGYGLGKSLFLGITNTHTHLTSALVRAACYGTSDLQVAAFEWLL